jgi:hypothetical protein
MRSETWEKLDRLAQTLRKQSIRVSAGQVAAIALEQGLLSVDSVESIQVFVSSKQEGDSIKYDFSPEVLLKANRIYQAMVRHPLYSCES